MKILYTYFSRLYCLTSTKQKFRNLVTTEQICYIGISKGRAKKIRKCLRYRSSKNISYSVKNKTLYVYRRADKVRVPVEDC